MKQKLTKLKTETGNSIMLIGDFNIPLSKINKNRQNISKEVDLNNTQTLDIRDIYRTLY